MTPQELLPFMIDLTLAFAFMFALTFAMRWVDRNTEAPTGILAAILEPLRVLMVAAWFFGLLVIVVKLFQLWGLMIG